jgi:hypothetical protein
MADDRREVEGREEVPEFVKRALDSDEATLAAEEESGLRSKRGRKSGFDDDEADDGVRSFDSPDSRSRLGLGMIVVSLAIIAIGGIAILSKPEWRDQVEVFFAGEVGKYKAQERKAIEDRFKELESKTKPVYGDVTLTYFPQDARVSITDSVKIYNTYKDYQNGTVGGTEEKKIPNQTENLKPGEIVKSLPLNNMPVREREFVGVGIDLSKGGELDENAMKSADTKIRVHEYKIHLEKEGYKPRDFDFAESSWEKVGPDVNAIINFPGLDLEPEPETMKANYVAAKKEMYCLAKTEKDKEKLQLAQKEIQVRHHFKTTEEYERIEEQLRSDVEWFGKVYKDEIEKQNCK